MQDLKDLRATEIMEPEKPVREFITDIKIQELKESIKLVGIILPLIVKPVGDKYEIIAGHRRFIAGISAGLQLFPCLIQAEAGKNDDIKKIHENLYREDLNPIHEAGYYLYLKHEKQLTPLDIAKMIGKSEGYVRNRVAILSWDPTIQGAIEGGKISIAVGRELMKLQDEKRRESYTRSAIENGVTASVVAGWVAQYRATIYDERGQGHEIEIPDTDIRERYCTCPGCNGKIPLSKITPIYLCYDCHKALLDGMEKQRKES